MRWTLFCRVVDNFGDIGFAWRLAADLGSRGQEVCLAVDDPGALGWMAPQGGKGVTIVDWAAGASVAADVWAETFGCGFPDAAGSMDAPVRVNVEHLSAEAFVDHSHGRPSPRFTADGEPRPVWFFFPGFSDRSGGLILEPRLIEQRRRFGDGRDWLATRGIERRAGERCVSLFCYRNPALAEGLEMLAEKPTLLLLTPGFATEGVSELLGPSLQRGLLRAVRLPWLSQPEFDRMLWSCDLNFVRGEDSLVRALWAGAPFVWQLYPQDERVRAVKLDAFLNRFLEAAPATLDGLRAVFAAWNGVASGGGLRSAFASVDTAGWQAQCRRFSARCAGQVDLTSALLDLVALKR